MTRTIGFSSPPFRQAFQALPSYFGGKRRLVRWIFSKLATVAPVESWPSLTFADGFVGGGAVSLFAKAQGFGGLLANDWSERSQLVIDGLLVNQRTRLSRLDCLQAIAPVAEATLLIETEGTLSERHRQALASFHANLELVLDPTRRALLKLLLWHVIGEWVAFGTSIGTSNRPFIEVLEGRQPLSGLNTKRLVDGSFEKLLKPAWAPVETKRQSINRGIFQGAGAVRGFQQDTLDWVQTLETADILYLDPPYAGTLGYERANRMLDQLLFPGESFDVPDSPFSTSCDLLAECLLNARQVPIWLISYNNKVLDLDALQTLIHRVDPARQVQSWAKAYTHLAHVAKNPAQNQELLVLAVNREEPRRGLSRA